MGKRVKTVIASVLKPIDDTRMYEKIGHSLQQTNRYDVNIIGFSSKNIPKDPNIRFHSLYSFNRKSFLRLIASISFLKMLLILRPGLVIISTFELIPAALFYRALFQKTRLVYDIQENYALNLLSNRGQNAKARLLAFSIRQLEKFSQRYLTLNILAEKIYAKELSFVKNYLILLNKFNAPDTAKKPVPGYNSDLKNYYPVLIFSGTISSAYGARQSLVLVNELAKFFPRIKAKYIGHVPEQDLLKELKAIQSPYFDFQIDSRPIPHYLIIDEMSRADFGIVAHQPTISIKNCFPTRIYELMHFRIPILLQDHSPWVDYCQQWKACIALDYNHFDAVRIAEKMQTLNFYSKGQPDDIYWASEEKKLIKAIDLISHPNV